MLDVNRAKKEGLQQVHDINDKRQSESIHHYRASLVMFLVRALDLDTFPPTHFLLGIVISILVFKFLVFGPMAEHWFNHGSFLSVG